MPNMVGPPSFRPLMVGVSPNLFQLVVLRRVGTEKCMSDNLNTFFSIVLNILQNIFQSINILDNYDPDRLCQLQKKAACYFRLVI